eukprot:343396_1
MICFNDPNTSECRPWEDDDLYPRFDVNVVNAIDCSDNIEWPDAWKIKYDPDYKQKSYQPINYHHILAAFLSLLNHKTTKPTWMISGARDIGFTERIYGFVDKSNNLCIFTDTYHPNWISTFQNIPNYVTLQQYEDIFASLQQSELIKACGLPDVIAALIVDFIYNGTCDVNVWKNKDGRVEIDFGFYQRTLHRNYFVIARYPLASWKMIFDNTFWAFYGEFYFHILCPQHMTCTERNYKLYETIVFGRQFIPCNCDYDCGEEDWNYIFYPMNKDVTYAEICKYFSDHEKLDISITLFAIAYSNWCIYLSIKDVVSSNKAALIIASMICGGWTHGTEEKYDVFTYNIPKLRYTEILAVEETGRFVLNPFKYKFLSKIERIKLRAKVVQKYVEEESKWLDEYDDDPCFEIEYDVDMYAPLWKEIHSSVPLTKDDILSCLN